MTEELRDEIHGKIALLQDYYIFAAVNVAGESFAWPIHRLDRPNSFLDSALEAAHAGIKHWTRLQIDHAHDRYHYVSLEAVTRKPSWPDWKPEQWLKRAFSSRLIRDREHRVIKELTTGES